MKTKLSLLSVILAALLLCSCCACAEGILPVLQTPKPRTVYAISLDSTTGADYYEMSANANGGYDYYYTDVSYACYTRFSQKLGKEGYTLVSAETLDNNVSRAVVTNGTVTLTMDYDLETGNAKVSYPAFVFPRETALFDDYTELHDGDEILLAEDITATVTGWEPKDYYYNTRANSNYRSDENRQYIFLTLQVNYNLPDDMDSEYLIRDSAVFYGTERFDVKAQGIRDNNTVRNYRSKLTWKMSTPYAIAFYLTAEQYEHPDSASVVFTSYDNATRYVYHLQPLEAEQP